METKNLITTLEELIVTLAVKEFKKQDKSFQTEFANKVWENDQNPDLEMCMEYIQKVIEKRGLSDEIKVDWNDAGFFADKIGDYVEE
jgi:hypothetical protein